MFGYTALIWNTGDVVQSGAAQTLSRALFSGASGWHNVLEREGLSVFCTGIRPGSSEPCLLENDSGVVLGALFRRASDSDGVCEKVRHLSEHDAASVLATGGRALVESYWGRYVAFLCDSVNDAKWIIRDPTGSLECLTASFRGVNIYFSSFQGCTALNFLRFTINWRYVEASQVYFAMWWDTRDTGLNEVSRVLPGECVKFQRGVVSSECYWSPFRLVRSGAIEDAAYAAVALRHTTRACVRTWASCYGGILHLLSGGLDSSIVLGCLQDAPARPDITCLNYHYTRGSNSDEREFARIAAQKAKCRLIEKESDSQLSIEGLLRLPRCASPGWFVSEITNSEVYSQISDACAATAMFSGSGGDELFCEGGMQHTCADFVWLRGIRPALFRLAIDVAQVRRSTIWRVMREGVANGLARQPIELIMKDFRSSDLVAPDLRQSIDIAELLPAWFSRADMAPPGKTWQILTLARSSLAHGVFGRPNEPEDVAPLLSQPLIELCLRIPTYVLTAETWDRVLARRAFAQDVPPEILWRRIKCMVDEYLKHLFERNRKFVRDTLLGGTLVRERILDGAKLEAALSERPTADRVYASELLKLLCTEVWVNVWSTEQRRFGEGGCTNDYFAREIS